MNASTRAGGRAESARAARFHRFRRLKDRFARRFIALGGIAVIVAVVLILFYLLFVVLPLFEAADVESRGLGSRADWSGEFTLYTAVEEQRSVGLRIGATGVAEFFGIEGLGTVARQALLPDGATAVAAAEAGEGNGTIALALDDGSVLLARQAYRTSYAGGVENREIIPSIEFPYGEQPRELLPVGKAGHLAVSDGDKAVIVAAATGGRIAVNRLAKQENFLTGEISLQDSLQDAQADFEVSSLAISGNHRWLYAADRQGRVHRYALPELKHVQAVQVSNVPLTEMQPLLGGISILVGDAHGAITQLFPVRDDENRYRLEIVRRFTEQSAPIARILPEARRKGFVAIDVDGGLGIYHSTAGQRVFSGELEHGPPAGAALAPRANGLLLIGADGRADMLDIRNEHPEVSVASLWRKVWYENYQEPDFIWQSSSASNDFEPKFSLTPLAFGTLKAALFAMLFAVPIALMGAAYAAYFMAPALREFVKPTIEIMAALPTVILGFLAGLWFAPFIEENLASLVSMALLLPPGLLLFAYWWSHYRGPAKSWVKEGWEPALLLPVLAGLIALSLQVADPMQQLVFGGDMRRWISEELGVSYDQRNALVVGFAMGFAVIPTIFSMAEDAVFGVPKSLSDGSLALGATPWQTLVRVVLPTASPGIFSALMIGLGRAVGETMIVLMATGNTPVMDWSIFEGMRTLAANIAVEMPESEVNSSHYRILFLAALVLFLFTFVVNTGAELVRQRLRERYSSL